MGGDTFSKSMHRLGTKTKYRMILTGTVITNKAIDIFSQYKFVDPSIFGNSLYAFRNKYSDYVRIISNFIKLGCGMPEVPPNARGDKLYVEFAYYRSIADC